MKCSDRGLAIIKSFEGLRLKAYQDSVGIWTIGYGHTGADVFADLTIDEAEADNLLRQDLADAESCIEAYVNLTISQEQFDALCSFVFNLGCKAFKNSTLVKLINAYQFEAAALQFSRWAKAGGVELAGLVRRREAERELFLA